MPKWNGQGDYSYNGWGNRGGWRNNSDRNNRNRMYAMCGCCKDDPAWLFVSRMEFGAHAGYDVKTGEPLRCKKRGAFWARICADQKYTWRGMQKQIAEIEKMGGQTPSDPQGTASETQKLVAAGKTTAEALRELADREEKRASQQQSEEDKEVPIEKLSMEDKKKLLDRISTAQRTFDESLKIQEQCREKLSQAEARHKANETKLLELKTQNELDHELLRQCGARDRQEQIEAEKAKQDKSFRADRSKFKLKPETVVDPSAMRDKGTEKL